MAFRGLCGVKCNSMPNENENEVESRLIASESPELSLGEAPGWFSWFGRAFPAFSERNFRLYFNGQLISMIGTWLQTVAQGWLVLELTHSAFWVGAIAALGMLPTVIFGLPAGVVVDRYDKRKILIAAQVISMVLAAILGFLAIANAATLAAIALLAFLSGVVNALDLPARQAFTFEIVRREHLASAIALASATFNASRIVGPAMAGILISLIGTGGTFLVNAASFIAAIVSLVMITGYRHEPEHHPHPLKAIRAGIAYAFSHPLIRTLLITSAVVSFFGFSYTAILPAVVEQVFGRGAAELGYLYAASGVGAVVAAILISAFSRRIGANIFIVGGNLILGASLAAFAATGNFELGLAASFFIGLGFASAFAMMNTTIQHAVENQMRGRVMSLFVLTFLGVAPFGNFAMGAAAERFGPPAAIAAGAGVVLLAGIVLLLRYRHLARGGEFRSSSARS